MIEDGTWKARGVEGTLAYTSKGNEQVAVDLVLLDGPNAGTHITWYGYFTDATFERTVESLRLLGWQGNDFSDLTGIDTKDVQAVIEAEADLQGEYRPRVKWINGPGGIAVKDRMDAGAAAAFAQKMKGKVLALGQQSGQRPTGARTPVPSQQRQAAQPPITNAPSDDIPF